MTCTTTAATGSDGDRAVQNQHEGEGEDEDKGADEGAAVVIQRGDVVTFSYGSSQKESGGPGGCFILRKRSDLSWRDVLFLHNQDRRYFLSLLSPSYLF